MGKLLKILFRIDVALLFISIGLFLIGFLAFKDGLIDFKTRNFFVKKIVQVKGIEPIGDGLVSEVSFCFIDNEKVYISTSKELELDKYYYVWFNSKTKHTYLTNKNSEAYDIFSFGPGTIMIVAAFCMSILFYLNMLFLRNKIINKYGKESL